MALTIVEEARPITGGVDTHADTHVAAALDPVGGLPGVGEFPATAAGYARLLGWLGGFGTGCLAGIEGTGRYGAGLARPITAAGIRVVEAVRPGRQDRRRQGKSDPLDAVSAARAAQSGRARGAPEGPGRRGGGDPGADGRPAQRRGRTHPDDRPGQGPGPDRPR
jgi:transposase